MGRPWTRCLPRRQLPLTKFHSRKCQSKSERDGSESQVELAISSGTVDRRAPWDRNSREVWERMRNKQLSTMVRFVGSMIDCSGTAHVSRHPMHCDLVKPTMCCYTLRGPRSVQRLGSKSFFQGGSGPRVALSNLQTSNQHSKSFQEVEVSRGTYLSFIQIRDEEGQDQDGFNAAMPYCARATKLGGKWTRLTRMTDRAELLYLRKEFTETLSGKWVMYLTPREESQTSSSGGQPTAPCAGSIPATPATPAKMSRICGRVEPVLDLLRTLSPFLSI